MIPTPSGPPAGWYPDPITLNGQQRYFDGQSWTGHVAPGAPLVTAPPRRATYHGTNHAAHLLITLLTCGLWLPVWIIVAACQTKRIEYH